MDNRYISNVIEEMQPFMEEHGYKLINDFEFVSETKSFRVDYDESTQSYKLFEAAVECGDKSEEKCINSWLFDDTQNVKDADSVGIDFTNSVKASAGIKIKRTIDSSIDMPTNGSADGMTVSGFAKKTLDIYPQLKDVYKEHMVKYGSFLYVEFFSENLVPLLRSSIMENNKKTNKKLFEYLDNAYVKGDKDTVNIVVASIGAAICGDEKTKSMGLEILSEDKHLRDSVTFFLPHIEKNKKLKSALL